MPVDFLTQSADSGARLAIRLLQDAAQRGDIDPWDVDVIPVVDGFLDQLKQRIEIPKKISQHFSQHGGSYEVDLAQSSEAFLAASVLVGLKAEVLEAEMFSVDIENEEQIKLIEIATNDEVYKEEDLFKLYMRFQFDINQLLNYRNAYKLLEDYEARALLYQILLLTSEIPKKLNLLSLLKKSFDQSNLPNAFDEKLASHLKNIPEDEIPSNYTTFFMKNKEPEKLTELKIKLNNKVFHQSKVLNYFQNKTSLPQVEKETNDLLKKIKKNKKYVFSLKDIIVAVSYTHLTLPTKA